MAATIREKIITITEVIQGPVLNGIDTVEFKISQIMSASSIEGVTDIYEPCIIRSLGAGGSRWFIFVIKNSNPSCAYTSKMNHKINVYSFALKPEEHQPSGTCNFSRIDTTDIIFDNSTTAPTSEYNIYAVNYNVLRIMSGMGGLAYSN